MHEGQVNSMGRFVGTSAAIQKIYCKIKNIAATNTPVFITGESGVGKEICARALHDYSVRHDKPFIALNCAALPHDLFESALFGHIKGAFTGAHDKRAGAIESAEGGTLFLDEICDMPLNLQAKLLRFTQDHQYQKLGCDKIYTADIRIVCATNSNPQAKIDDGLFREDLFYRLHVFPIAIPPLRLRGGDILDIAVHYLSFYAADLNKKMRGFSDSAAELLQNYDWPGNIRELQNVIQQILANHDGTLVTANMLPDPIRKSAFKKMRQGPQNFNHISLPLWQIEKRAIENAIHSCNGNILKAAALLEISPSTIYRKLQDWNKK